jgi:hypothetical protein
MSVWQAARAADAALTRTVTGVILAPRVAQRLVVSGMTGIYSSASPGKDICMSIDHSGEMVTRSLQLIVQLKASKDAARTLTKNARKRAHLDLEIQDLRRAQSLDPL